MKDIIEKFFLLRKEKGIIKSVLLKRFIYIIFVYYIIYFLLHELRYFFVEVWELHFVFGIIVIKLLQISKIILYYCLLILLIKIIYGVKNSQPINEMAFLESQEPENISLENKSDKLTDFAIFFLWILYIPFAYFIFVISGMAWDSGSIDLGSLIFVIIINGLPLSIVFAMSGHLVNQSYKTGNKYIDGINSIDASEIKYIHFKENNGKGYKIEIDSIKKIAKYINVKYKKTVFEPNELKNEKDYLLKNYRRNLSQENYDILVNTLNNWVISGGNFEIVTY